MAGPGRGSAGGDKTPPIRSAYRGAMRPDQIALQLYTVRRLARDDLAGTLRAVASAGYRSVEVAGIPEAAAADLGRLLADAGLEAIAAHQGLDLLRADTSGVVDWLRELSCPRVVVPSLPDEERATPDGVRRLVAELNELAERLAGEGVRLGYHNHAAEFAPLDGTTTWQILLSELSDTVELEVDVFWASVGGRDPVDVIADGGRRVRLLHMKDRQAGEGASDAPAGAGSLDFAAIVEAGRAAGVAWYIAEQDEPASELADIATARRNLLALAGP